MDFSYDNGSCVLWYGSPDLEPMYTAYRKQAAYCAAHGFSWAAIPANRKSEVTAEILLRVMEIVIDAGLDVILWLVPQAENEWSIYSRELDPVYTYFESIIQAIDDRPDIAEAVQYVLYAPEIAVLGTAEELESYLSWLQPIFRGWLDQTNHMRGAQLSGGLRSTRVLIAVPHDGEKLSVISKYVDIPSISEYSPTDMYAVTQLETWRRYPDGLGNPFLITEMNNSARKQGDAEANYNEENYYGYIPRHWLAWWENIGVRMICLHRGNSSRSNAYAWFDQNGDPLPWLSDYLADYVATRRRWHGYLYISELPPDWTYAQRTTVFTAMLCTMGWQLERVPSSTPHERVSADRSKVIVEAVLDHVECAVQTVNVIAEQALSLEIGSLSLQVEPLGGLNSTWQESRDACHALMAAQGGQW